jgi:hypothetical protein
MGLAREKFAERGERWVLAHDWLFSARRERGFSSVVLTCGMVAEVAVKGERDEGSKG